MKVKEQPQKQQEKEFEQDLSFAQWLDYFSKEPTSKELDEMEKEFTSKKLYGLKPSNNINYYPLQGA